MFSGLVNLLFGASEIENSNINSNNNNKSSESIINIEPGSSICKRNNCISSTKLLATEIPEEEDDDDWLLVNKEEFKENEEEEEEQTDKVSLLSTDPEDNYNWNSHHQFDGPVVISHPSCHNDDSESGLEESFLFDVLLSPTSAATAAAAAATNISLSPTSMEESWFITPPPCFTSTGPIYVKTSPYENLLIEHPSMSVYRNITYVKQISRKSNSISPSPKPSEEKKKKKENYNSNQKKESQKPPVKGLVPLSSSRRNRKQKKQSAAGAAERERESQTVRHVEINNVIKQDVERRTFEKAHIKKEYQSLCRGVLKRSNKVHEINGKANNRRRRSDLQHFRYNSGANNNRKC